MIVDHFRYQKEVWLAQEVKSRRLVGIKRRVAFEGKTYEHRFLSAGRQEAAWANNLARHTNGIEHAMHILGTCWDKGWMAVELLVSGF